VKYNPSASYSSGGLDSSEFYNLVENTSVISSQSNLSASAALKVMIGGTYKLDNKTDVAAGTESSLYNQSLLANYYFYKQPKYVRIEEVSFRPQILDVLKTPGAKVNSNSSVEMGSCSAYSQAASLSVPPRS